MESVAPKTIRQVAVEKHEGKLGKHPSSHLCYPTYIAVWQLQVRELQSIPCGPVQVGLGEVLGAAMDVKTQDGWLRGVAFLYSVPSLGDQTYNTGAAGRLRK